MSLNFDSCGRYVPKVGDDLCWRFRGTQKPFKASRVVEVRNRLFGIKRRDDHTLSRAAVFLDPGEIEVRE